MKIVIRKKARRLELHREGEPVKGYRIALGSSPVGDKEREGDGRTPEGEFVVCVKNPNSKYTLSLGLNYPTIQDAERGLRDGLISSDQHTVIVEANRAGRRPPWDTPLGGEIFVHGGGTSRDWTVGCIAMDDDDIRELYGIVEVGTPVTIEP